MRAVNLLPEDAQPRRLSAPPLAPTLGVAACVLAAGAVGVAAHVESGKVAHRQQQLDALKLRLAEVPAPEQSSSGATVAFLTGRSQRIAALNGALGGRPDYDRVLRQLALVLPGDVWLDSLQLTQPSSTAAAAGGTTSTTPDVTIDGYTYSTDSVAGLLQRLSVVPTLKDVGLVSAKVELQGKKNVFHFTINANLVGAGGAR